MGWIQTRVIGRLTSVLVAPCSVPPSIWITAAVPALFKLFWSYNEPDAKHIIHQVQGHSWLCSAKGLLAASGSVDPLYPKPATRAIFQAIEWVDLASWWFFIAAIGIDGYADWTSSIMHTRGCMDAPPYNGYGDECSDGGVADNQWITGPEWRAADWPTTPGAGPGMTISPGGFGLLAGTCQITNLDGLPLAGGLRVCLDDETHVLDADDIPLHSSEFGRASQVQGSFSSTDGKFHQMFIQSRAFSDGVLPRYIGSGGHGVMAYK